MKYFVLLMVSLYSVSTLASNNLRLLLTLDGSNKITIHSDGERHLVKFELAENSVPQVFLYKIDQGRFVAVNDASPLTFFESEKLTKFKGLQTRIWMLENGKEKPRQFVEDRERATTLTDDITGYYEAKEGFAEGSKISDLKKTTQAKILKNCNLKVGVQIDKKPLSGFIFKVNPTAGSFTKLCQNPDYAETIKNVKSIRFSKSPNDKFTSTLDKTNLRVFIPRFLDNTTEVAYMSMVEATKAYQAKLAAEAAEAAAKAKAKEEAKANKK